MNKTILYQLLALLLLFGITTTANAQVTIGSNKPPEGFSVLELDNKGKTDKGGLRLPHLTTGKRNALSAMQAFLDEQHRKDGTANPPKEAGLALGLTIYNTDTNCMEYWSGYKWVSLCLGIASIEVGNYPQTNPIPPGGGETLPMIPNEVPKCTSNPPYSIAVAVGAAYANAYIIEQSTGEFKVYMNDNPTAKGRTAIVRLTNNCTGEYKEFVFNQEGNAGLCGQLTDKPVLTASNGGVICGSMGNSIILAVSNPVNRPGSNPVVPATYIWMRNDNEEIGRGKSITVSQGGSYKVYAGGVSCGNNDFSAPINVIVNEAGTAPAELTIMASNGAVVCGGTAVTLSVKDYSAVTGTVLWYKDGVKLAEDSQQNILVTEAGNYMALVSESGCMSNPSNAVDVTVQAGTKVTFTKADIEINSKTLDLGDPSFCSGGWLNMKIVNVEIGYIYKWIVNGVQVGTGKEYNYQLPGGVNTDINLSIIAESGAANSCPNAITIGTTMSVHEPLDATISGPDTFCGNAPGGIQLSTSGGGAAYVWKNMLSGVETETYSVNSLTTTLPGTYQVTITTDAGCVSVTPTPKKVGTLGTPLLGWEQQFSIVGDGETVAFIVNNNGSPVTKGYTWTATSLGGATAIIPPGTTGDRASIKFAGGGGVRLSITAEGFCGKSAPLTIDVMVNQIKPTTPVIAPGPSTAVCGGYRFTLSQTTLDAYEALYGTNFTIRWDETITGGITGQKQVSGANGRDCYIPFTSPTEATIKMKASCISDGQISDASAELIVRGNQGTIIEGYSISGQQCYDIKKTNWEDAGETACGLWDKRSEAIWNEDQVYELKGTKLPADASDITWTVVDESNLVNVDLMTTPTLNSVNIRFYNHSLNTSIIGNKEGLNVTLIVTFNILNAGCSTNYSKSMVINIRDCDCCSTMTDQDNLTYTTYRFGGAGCWMTENLATTRKPNNTALTSNPPGTGNATKAKPKASGGQGWGRHYDWNVTMNGQAFETIGTNFSGGSSTVQGICPDGWLLPSDYDWNQLEKEIATNPTAYSTNIKVWTWNRNTWERGGDLWRPDGTNTAGGWGESMKSARVVDGLVNANGKSNVSERGFDALLVGYNGSINSYSYFWSSSAYSSTGAWSRYLFSGTTGVGRFYYNKTYQFSVRCKKKVN